MFLWYVYIITRQSYVRPIIPRTKGSKHAEKRHVLSVDGKKKKKNGALKTNLPKSVTVSTMYVGLLRLRLAKTLSQAHPLPPPPYRITLCPQM